MYLIDASSKVSDSENDNLLSEIIDISGMIYSEMDDDETFWIVSQNRYTKHGCWSAGMQIADKIRDEVPFTLKNIITVHTEREQGGKLDSIYEDILFLVKDKRAYKFHKDDIRVPHVYKGNEWGGEREKGNSAYHDTEVRRYNPDGKDPSNLWTREDRTQSSGENVDETNPISMSEAIERCVRVGSDENETVYTVWMDSTSEIEGRNIETFEVEVK